jgi:hypothetical protein
MKIWSKEETTISSIVVETDSERAIHRFLGPSDNEVLTGRSSSVEVTALVNGKPWGTSKLFIVEHDDRTTANMVFQFLKLPQFVAVRHDETWQNSGYRTSLMELQDAVIGPIKHDETMELVVDKASLGR